MSSLKERIDGLRDTISGGRESDSTYMSKMRHWCCVHTTRYEPKQNIDGDLYIETTAMATDNELPRSSIHVTLNQVVASHMGGNWDNVPIVVLAPYNDVVALNGNPMEVATEDTWFIPNPDKGLVLPSSAYIVRPSEDNSKLFEIGENSATYKTDNYTNEEIEEILSLNNFDKYEYENLMRGNLSKEEAHWILGHDEKLINLYENSKDKQAFMRGVLEEDRFVILNKLLRNAVVKMTMEKMDFRYVLAHEDSASRVVSEVAIEEGMRGNSGNKGHSFSLEAELERQGCELYYISKEMKSKDIDKIYNILTSSNLGDRVMSCILEDKPFEGGYEIYKETFVCYIKDMSNYLTNVEELKEGGINGYNPYLDITLHRNADKMASDINQSLDELKEKPEQYEKLKKRLEVYKKAEINLMFSNSNEMI